MTYLIGFVIITTFMQTYVVIRQIIFLKNASQNNEKAITYNVSKLYLALIKYWFINLLIIGFFYNNILEYLLIYWQNILSNTLLNHTALLLSILIFWQLINLPFTYYQIFIIEKRFGFNNTTFRTFILDTLKQLGLFFLFSLPITLLMNWFLTHTSLWWLWSWMIIMGSGGLIIILSPLIQSRLFYKLTPLTNLDLIATIRNMLTTYHFSLNKVFLINSSARTKHSNAHLIGFGRFKRILLSDTLLKKFNNEEIAAIVAHEIGHYYHKHIVKHFVFMASIGLVSLFLLNVLSITNIITLSSLLLLSPMLLFWSQPVLCSLTRFYETQADQFAINEGYGDSLHKALIKLYRNNSSILKSDVWYSIWFDTHPPPWLRINSLDPTSNSVSQVKFKVLN